MVFAVVISSGMLLGAPVPPAAAQVRNLKWRIQNAAVHGRFDLEIARFQPRLEAQAAALLRKKKPRLFGRFNVLARRYEHGRLVSDKVQITPAPKGTNRIDFDIRGRVVADRYASVLRWKRRRPTTRWVRRGTVLLARYRLIGRAVLSAVQGERLAGRPLRLVVRGKRLRVDIRFPVRLKLALKLRNKKLTTRRLAVLDEQLLRRHPLLRTARLVSLQFLRSGKRYLRVRFVAR